MTTSCSKCISGFWGGVFFIVKRKKDIMYLQLLLISLLSFSLISTGQKVVDSSQCFADLSTRCHTLTVLVYSNLSPSFTIKSLNADSINLLTNSRVDAYEIATFCALPGVHNITLVTDISIASGGSASIQVLDPVGQSTGPGGVINALPV
jgi:hypothetical protein